MTSCLFKKPRNSIQEEVLSTNTKKVEINGPLDKNAGVQV